MLVFTGAKEAKFPYFSKGKPDSSWLISKFSYIFLYKSSFSASNSWLAFCFVLSSALSRSSRITGAWPTHTSYIIHLERLLHMTVSGSERKVFITFQIWIFFLKECINSLQEAFIHPPEPREARFIMDGCALLDFFWTGKKKTSAHCHFKAWKGKEFFLYISDWIPLKEESHVHLGCLEGE